ncbi:hypothetical protein Bpfe_013517, partial [Biomphalaria pfeifferi]
FPDKQVLGIYMNLRILQLTLQMSLHATFSLSSDSGRVFGCYMFGRGDINTYATPISFGNTSNTFNFKLTES